VNAIANLTDPGEVEHAIEALMEAVTGTRPSPMAGTVSDLIVSPLVAYIEAEHQRTAGKGHQGTTTAMEFVIAAEDLAGRLANPAEALFVEHVNILERKWREFLVVVGHGAHIFLERKVKKESDRQRKIRGKRTTWGGKTKREIRQRNDKIVSAYQQAHQKNPSVTPPSFAFSNAKEYKLKPDTIRKIIEKVVGI
jgi:hypothetical protein